MSVSILIISHDGIGTSLIDTAKHMISHCPLTIEILDTNLEYDPDELYKTAFSLVEKIDQGDGILILTDLFGSTPSNIAHRLSERNNINVVTGINLSMLIRILNYPHLNLESMTKKAFSGGIDGIKINSGDIS